MVLRCTLPLWRVPELSFEDLPTPPAARFGVTQAQGQTQAEGLQLLITYTRNSGGGSLASRLARFLRHREPPPQFSFGPLPGESRTRRLSPPIRKSGDHKKTNCTYIHNIHIHTYGLRHRNVDRSPAPSFSFVFSDLTDPSCELPPGRCPTALVPHSVSRLALRTSVPKTWRWRA